jgi:hypothetical protein
MEFRRELILFIHANNNQSYNDAEMEMKNENFYIIKRKSFYNNFAK